MDQEDCWYTLTAGIVHRDKPAIFGPQDINPIVSHSFTGSQDAGMWTRNEFEGFWDGILINAASRKTHKNFSQNPFVYTTARERTDSSHYYNPRTEFFVDKMISSGNFKDNFWPHLDLFSTCLSFVEFISQSFCSSSLSLKW